MTKVKYRVIDNHILAASIYDESTNTRRDSQLDLDYCLSRDQRDKSTWIPAPGPKSLTDPHLSHTTTAKWKLSSSDSYSRNTITLRGRKLVLRTEQYCFLLPNRVSFTEINFKDYIRCTKTGRLEWMHPPYKPTIPDWLDTAMSDVPSSDFETAVNLAKNQLTNGLSSTVGSTHKDWMKDTYLDNGQLIRHGS